MSKGSVILVLGLFLAFLPFTGFPSFVKATFAVVAGLSVAALAFLVRQERLWLLRTLSGAHTTDAYTENGAPYVPSRETQEA